MAKYRILVENLDAENPFDGDGEPIECEGFVILADNEDPDVIIHHVSTMKMAQIFASFADMQAALLIANGIREAIEYEKARAKRSVIGDLMRKFGMEDDD